MKEYLKSLIGLMFGAIALTLPATASAQPISPGGGSSNWEITTEAVGANTYTFPIPDSATQGGYRMTTNSKDWATGKWTIDGVLQSGNPGVAAFDSATWNTPTPYTGSAEAKGQYTFRVKWVGTGTPPTYMYLAMNSAVCSFDDPGLAGVSLTGSNGQSDPFLVAYGVGSASGTHAKRLKLNSTGEATYTVNLNTKAQKSSTYADLKASAAATVSLTAKALGLFKETWKRTLIQFSDHETIHTDPAWTGDVEHETAEIGASEVNGSGQFQSTFSVDRVGSWNSPSGPFTSNINPGWRQEIYPPTVLQIIGNNSYSIQQLVGMRASPQTITLHANSSDPNSLIPGPFDATIDLKVWAPERIISKLPVDHVDRQQIAFLSGQMTYTLAPGASETFTVSTAQTVTYSATVTLSRGFSLGAEIPELVKAGVTADGSLALGLNVSKSITLSLTETITTPPMATGPRKWKKYQKVTKHDLDRKLASYGDGGYSHDFPDVVEHSSAPTLEIEVISEAVSL